MHDLGTLLRQSRFCWTLVGDWNQRPEDMASSGFPSFVHGAIVSINECTCRQGKGSIIDYVIVHRGLETAVKMELDEESPWSPHLGIRIVLDVPRLDHRITTWYQAKPIEASVPGASQYDWESCLLHGPRFAGPAPKSRGARGRQAEAPVQMHHQACTVDDELTTMYQQFSTKAEVYLHSRAGTLVQASSKSMGRGAPRVSRITTAAPKRAPEEKYYYRDANTLGRLRCYLGIMAQARNRQGVEFRHRVEAKLRNAVTKCKKVLPPAPCDNTRQLLQSLDELEGEASGGRRLPGLSLRVIIARLGVAITGTARQAADRHNVSFKQWVHDHIGSKPGALYRYSNQDNLPQGILDEVHLEGGVLCTSKELMDHRVATWTGIWGAKRNPMQASMAGAPAKAALGSDQWRPHDWAALPEEGIHDVMDIIHAIEGKGRWPAQVLRNLVVFIGKPTPTPSAALVREFRHEIAK